MNNNDYRRKAFEKRRSYKGTISMCEGYDCPIFSNCLVEIKQLKIQISAREEVCNRLESNWNKLKEYLHNQIPTDKTVLTKYIKIFEVLDKMQEIEGNDSNE